MSKKYQLKDSEFYLKPAELNKVVYTVPSFRDRCILKTFIQSGIRRAELASLDIRDVDLESRRLRIREGKGAKERVHAACAGCTVTAISTARGSMPSMPRSTRAAGRSTPR